MLVFDLQHGWSASSSYTMGTCKSDLAPKMQNSLMKPEEDTALVNKGLGKKNKWR